MSEINAEVLHNGQLAVATVEQSGTIVATGGEIDATALVQTENGKQLCVKTYPLNSGGGGSSDYADLSNKPSINSVTLSGNKTSTELGVASSDLSNVTEDAKKSVSNLLGAIYNIQLYTTKSDTVISAEVLTTGQIQYKAFPSDWLSKSIEVVYSFNSKTLGPDNHTIATFPYNSEQQGLYLANSGRTLYCFFGGSYDFDLTANTKYKIKVVKVGYTVYVYKSENESDYVLISTQNLNEATYNDSVNSLYGVTDQITWNLKETYVKIDGQFFFMGGINSVAPAHLAMPSNTAVPLTWGPSFSVYTMPADGYLEFTKNGTSGIYTQFVCLPYDFTGSTWDPATVSSLYMMASHTWASSQTITFLIPVRKGMKVAAHYTSTMTQPDEFNFIYAQGSESEAAN